MSPSSQRTQHTTFVMCSVELVLEGGLGCQLSLGLCVVLGCVDTVLVCVSFNSLQSVLLPHALYFRLLLSLFVCSFCGFVLTWL